MDNKILFENSENEFIKDTDDNKNNKKESQVTQNLFQGRIEAETKNANFPDWDIVPPYQFINPRIK